MPTLTTPGMVQVRFVSDSKMRKDMSSTCMNSYITTFWKRYMRSGNIPGRYEIENTGNPTYVPSLFHWGTSVIMDGKFDDDKPISLYRCI